MALLSPLVAILALLIWGQYTSLCKFKVLPIADFVLGRIAIIREDRACVIGLTKLASLSLLCYDLFMTVFLTGMFVWPLYTATVSERIRAVAWRTLLYVSNLFNLSP
jgi:hypothetical protein